MRDLLWLVPLLPLLGALANGLLVGRRASEKTVSWIACGSSGAAALLGVGVIANYLRSGSPRPFALSLWEWMAPGVLPTARGPVNLSIGFGLLLDPLSVVMLFVVTFVGFWIHLYSVGYMAGEPGFRRYFTYLNLFLVAMLVLVLGDGYASMFLGWEGVGLCSYLVIGFYFDRESAADAGRKAFIVNRIGDFALLAGLFALAGRFGTLQFAELSSHIAASADALRAPYVLGLSLAGFVALCLFLGATGKSAQIPLYVWLPDAMAGPTPVSALIHAATMVTAGVYLVVRSNAIFQLAPEISALVAWVGAATALLAAGFALVQTDLKKVLAYSTISQLGYMFLAAGLGAYSAAIFHLATHAFFKALLFLAAGAVIHVLGGEQDLRRMGGLWRRLPTTARTFGVGALAIAGIFPFAGFWSKDAILSAAAASGTSGHWVLYAIGLLTAGLTSFYMFRAFALAFLGRFRGEANIEHHLHEAPWTMALPLAVLAAGAVAAGWLGIPEALGGEDRFGRFLEPVIARVASPKVPAEHMLSHAAEIGFMTLATIVAAIAILLALRIYRAGPERGEAIAKRFPRLHALLVHKAWVDEIYDATIVRGTWSLARLVSRFDAGAIDRGMVEGAGRLTVFSSWLSGLFDRHVIDGLVNFSGWLLDRFSRSLRRVQTGAVSNYAFALALSAFVLVCLYAVWR
ncbi:MAG TPA: NADH-quinone oxidoreductase subunit L [Thermoanaerobaculia bacterium]|jgi:NADH-quinone oxidoreductase subunit L|nr:NADH-quinone oxidoreductase subunit L [Thermoanaerobaculia bacterium]